eukprot:6212044-Pleurochrysis_carterae.AAC.1
MQIRATLAIRPHALLPSRSPAPCAAPILTTRRRAPSLTADVRLQAPESATSDAHHSCHGHVEKGRVP